MIALHIVDAQMTMVFMFVLASKVTSMIQHFPVSHLTGHEDAKTVTNVMSSTLVTNMPAASMWKDPTIAIVKLVSLVMGIHAPMSMNVIQEAMFAMVKVPDAIITEEVMIADVLRDSTVMEYFVMMLMNVEAYFIARVSVTPCHICY